MPTMDFNQYRKTAKFVRLNDHQLAYWSTQQEHPVNVLFIHGFPSASCDWVHQWHDMGRECNLLAMDLLGFGLSDKPYPYQYSLVQQADLLSQLLHKMNWVECHVVAHDYGDSVVQELLYLQEQGRLPCRIQSISFLNGGLFPEAHRPLLIQKCLKSPLGSWIVPFIGKTQLSRGFKQIFASNTPPEEQELDMIWQLLHHNDGRRCMPAILQYIDERLTRRDDWLQSMQMTRTPLQFINGVHDPISGGHMVERGALLVEKMKAILLPVGHYPQLEAPDLCTSAIREMIGI